MDQIRIDDLSADSALSLDEVSKQLRLAIKPYKEELGDIGSKIEIAENVGYLSLKAGSAAAAQIRLRKNGLGLWIKEKDQSSFPDFKWEPRSDKMVMTVFPTLDRLLAQSYKLCEIAVKTLPIGEGFGCCHRYEQCSDAKRCIHPEALVSLACSYRRNLEQGRIFYGKNRNIR